MEGCTLSAAAIVLLAATTACTKHSAPEPAVEHELPSEHEPPREWIEAPPVTSVWRWVHRGEGGWSADIGPKQIETTAYRCDFEQPKPDAAGQVCCEAASRFCVGMQTDFVPGISLASDGWRLYVADYSAIASGARFAAYDLGSGELMWTRAAVGIGPQEHSKYSNVVQLRLIDRALIAYGDEAHGAYIEAMDPKTGELREHTTLVRPRVEWRWDEGSPEPGAVIEQELADAGRCRFEARDRAPSELRCEPNGSPAWTRKFEDNFAFARGVLALDGRRVVTVTWNELVNKSRARAWTLADGELAWDRQLEGAGPQSPGEYSSTVQVEIADGLVLVRAREGHDRYVEALDLDTGAPRWSVRWLARE